MRINEILTESQLEQLDEGPIGSALGAVGRGIGKAVGGVAKGVGAVAGGVVGAGRALKKGYQAGKAVVGDDPDPNAGQPGYTDPAAPAAGGGAPAAAAAPTAVAPSGAAPAAGGTPPSTQDINAQGPAGTAPAKPQTGAAGAALAKTTAAVDKQTSTKAGETVYAQIKANVDKLDKKGKQQILQLLQKSMSAPAAPAKPGAAPAGPAGAPAALDPRDLNKDGTVDATEKSIARNKAKPGAAPTATTAAPDPGAAAFGNMAGQLAKGGATEPTAATPAATPPASTAATPGSNLTPQQTAAQQALKAKLKAGGGEASGRSGFNNFKKRSSIATASKVNYGNALSEALAQRVETHKQKMFETGLAQGTTSIFRK